MSSYSQLLKDPRWQRRRLEVLQRENFTCQGCGATDRTLHVHHGCYWSNQDPWNYPDQLLHCLCEQCHIEAQEFLSLIQTEVGQVPLSELDMVLDYICTLNESRNSAPCSE